MFYLIEYKDAPQRPPRFTIHWLDFQFCPWELKAPDSPSRASSPSSFKPSPQGQHHTPYGFYKKPPVASTVGVWHGSRCRTSSKGEVKSKDSLLLQSYTFRTWKFWQWKITFQAHRVSLSELHDFPTSFQLHSGVIHITQMQSTGSLRWQILNCL